MKRQLILILTLAIAALGAPCFASAVHVSADLTADFATGASAPQIIATFLDGSQPVLGGFGWEVILGRMGFGGDYEVDFHKDASASWWLDWYAPALYLSLHPVGANHFLDPFVQIGFGSAGRVSLQGMSAPDFNDQLMLSLFPFVAAGLGLNISNIIDLVGSYARSEGGSPAFYDDILLRLATSISARNLSFKNRYQ